MSRIARFDHRFVKSAPQQLEEGVLYVSLEYSTILHLCACGCRSQVVTPLAPDPNGWTMSFDGASVSLSPSIGNWSFRCRSHYWIAAGGKVRWARTWSDEEIAWIRGQAPRPRRQRTGGGWRSTISNWSRGIRSR